MECPLDDALSLALDIDRFMRRLQAGLHPLAREIDIEKVGPLGGMILITIAEHQPIAPQALAKYLARDKAQMTRIIQMMERKNLLCRTASKTDGRVSLISLTERGHTLVEGFQGALAEVIKDLLAPLEDEEKQKFSEALRKALGEAS